MSSSCYLFFLSFTGIDAAMKDAYQHNVTHDLRVKKCVTYLKSPFRNGVKYALEGNFRACIGLITPCLTMDGGDTAAVALLKEWSYSKESFVREISIIIGAKIQSIKDSVPRQCCFIGVEGGTAGIKHFFPYASPRDPSTIVTTERPQFCFLVHNLTMSVDNIMYWKGLQNCMAEEISNAKTSSSVHVQLSDLGYAKTSSAWKELLLQRMAKVCEQFQHSRGNEYGRLVDQFLHRLDQVLANKQSSPYIASLISSLKGQKTAILKEWELNTFTLLHELCLELESDSGAPYTASPTLFEAQVTLLFTDSNPRILQLIKNTRV